MSTRCPRLCSGSIRCAVQGRRCEEGVCVVSVPSLRMRLGHLLFITLITISAVMFASSVTWCFSQVWIVCSLFSISLLMWGIKSPLYVPTWDPDYRGKRIAHMVFNSFFTVDMWYDMALGVRLMTSRLKTGNPLTNEIAWIITTCIFCCLCPIDYLNFILRTSIPLECMPRQSHAMNLLMEVPMLALNLFIILEVLHTPQDRALGWFSVGTTCLTVFNASIMLFFHERIIGYRTIILTAITQTMKPLHTMFRSKANLNTPDATQPSDEDSIPAPRTFSDPGLAQEDGDAGNDAPGGGGRGGASIKAAKSARRLSSSDLSGWIQEHPKLEGDVESAHAAHVTQTLTAVDPTLVSPGCVSPKLTPTATPERLKKRSMFFQHAPQRSLEYSAADVGVATMTNFAVHDNGLYTDI